MKKVLIITFFFNQKDIGAIRLRGLVKNLPTYGWNPTVLTVKPPENSAKQIQVFETSYIDKFTLWKKRLGIPINKSLKEQFNLPTYKEKKTLIDIIIQLWAEIFTYPDPTINWAISAIEKGNEIIKESHFDAIVSSMTPLTSHIIANDLVRKNKIPWIADFRDLWTQNHYDKNLRIRHFFERRLELRTLSSANALTTVSQPLVEKLKELHKNKNVYSIPNGYDPEQLNPGIPLTKKFSITYTGRLYKGRRDPEPLFKVLKILIDENKIDPKTIEINFFGSDEGWLIRDIKKYQLEKIIQIHGQISREVSIQKQRESQVLLHLT